MRGSVSFGRVNGVWKQLLTQDQSILLLSVLLQLTLGIVFGHAYDMPIFMATGYLVGSGQNPYVAQDLTAVFQNNSFQGMNSVGYPPPWPLVLGILYRSVYALVPNLMVYNLVIKLPVIAANIYLAYLVADILKNLRAEAAVIRKAWIFMLLCPPILYFGSAWGQFDSIVALLSLLCLVSLDKGKLLSSAILLALAIAFKPIALPLFPVAVLYLPGKSSRQAFRYALWFSASLILFCSLPFLVWGWDLTPILRGWNAHFTVAGAMSMMTFFELLKDTYRLPGGWWLLGLAWIPAMGIAIYTLRRGIFGFTDLMRKSLGMILVFYLTRTWLSEPNVILILPLALILTATGELKSLALNAIWILPLVITIFNASPPQLLSLNFPHAMESMLNVLEEFRTFRLVARIAFVIPWHMAGWWIVVTCFKSAPSQVDGARSDLLATQA
ncbi:MAG: hypothetical protein A2Z45_07425 [Chloroflexi bacterium RBG_19FT_COMBO_55_16]|nr:MAG: hypothetical protein A2Z45_07425 [Chloroflexi bacterium RBG_19FT_COMBO_55_16]